MACGHYARKRKRFYFFRRVAVTVIALAIWFDESFIEKGPRKNFFLFSFLCLDNK